MATCTVCKDKRYKAVITLHGFKKLASNQMIADKLTEIGFTEVRVEGSGSHRIVMGTWSNPDATTGMPSEVTSVTEIT